MKDGFNLIRYRLGVLLSSGIANLLFLAIISGLIISYKGKDHYLNELEVDFAKESDIGESRNIFRLKFDSKLAIQIN